MATEIFYNCSIPRFGSMCQYEFVYYNSNHSYLYEIIDDFYRNYEYNSSNFTCYTHLQCNRSPTPTCLDWSEICDGKIDCSNGGFDEEYCWQLEVNECKDKEYRCANGQCIPDSFYQDDYNNPDCLDGSDEHRNDVNRRYTCKTNQPTFQCEDISCTHTVTLTSSCVEQRTKLLIDALYSIKDNSISDKCWLIFKCITRMPNPNVPVCDNLHEDEMSNTIIEQICPYMVFIPAVPVLFNDIYFAYTKYDLQSLSEGRIRFPYICYNTSRYDEFFINHSKIVFNNKICYRSKDSSSITVAKIPVWADDYLIPTYRALKKYHLIFNYTSTICNRSTMYQCINSSKCIAICIHGKCMKYYNNAENITFCQCYPGWSGRYCTIKHTSMCSSDSLCIGMTANHRSLCICPIHKFGPRCLLINTICSPDNNSTCKNNGQCVPIDEYIITSKQKYICICSKGFSGDRCEIIDSKIIVSFGTDIILPQSIFIHLIEVIKNNHPRRTTTFKSILTYQNSVIIHWSKPFHLIFIELPIKNYYLTTVQTNYHRSTTIVKTINSSDRCAHIHEIFNKTVVNLHHLRRIKLYHLPCQRHGQQRVANCFEFNHHMTFNCQGQSMCENGAQCFQDSPDCPQRSICICPSCFYGTKCQFSTNRFDLSLDTILGYHILPRINIIHQPLIVQISIALTIIFMIAGLFNGILAMITFKNKRVRDVGCSLYILGSSMTTLFTMIMFGLKFWILILAQMALISILTSFGYFLL
ncbi:unnamed protein product [Adineta steineri]|uniref:EGF-like domain-containing protein n=1 Tax=Adineta steineri TaxID=433720 RepID=A0A819M7J2_9BILA|nr:unnamed protein product [Adineta steineri]CAF3974868.1 unnamed protein product [Adineta steineri]